MIEERVSKFLMKLRSFCVGILVALSLTCQVTAEIFWDIPLGDQGEPIVVYLSPSCPHCLETLREIQRYVEKTDKKVTIKLIATGLRDLWVLRSIGRESGTAREFFARLLAYAANSKTNTPIPAADRDKVEALERSPEVKNTMLHLLSAGYSFEEVEEAEPSPESPLSPEDQEQYTGHIDEVTELNGGEKEVVFPFVVLNSKKVLSFEEATREQG
jgi:thiol-disulfide isomerase/thioredoxin